MRSFLVPLRAPGGGAGAGGAGAGAGAASAGGAGAGGAGAGGALAGGTGADAGAARAGGTGADAGCAQDTERLSGSLAASDCWRAGGRCFHALPSRGDAEMLRALVASAGALCAGGGGAPPGAAPLPTSVEEALSRAAAALRALSQRARRSCVASVQLFPACAAAAGAGCCSLSRADSAARCCSPSPRLLAVLRADLPHAPPRGDAEGEGEGEGEGGEESAGGGARAPAARLEAHLHALCPHAALLSLCLIAVSARPNARAAFERAADRVRVEVLRTGRRWRRAAAAAAEGEGEHAR